MSGYEESDNVPGSDVSLEAVANGTTGRTLQRIVEALSCPDSYSRLRHGRRSTAMPSAISLSDIVESLRAVLFPGYFGPAELTERTLPYYLGAMLDKVFRALVEQIKRGFLFTSAQPQNHAKVERRAVEIANQFLESLPNLRDYLVTDVQAAYIGDPAARSPGETIFCYPSIRALTNYRIAHQLATFGVPLIPRIITEMAHSETGIDIHPGAKIGKYFFMDHGTGIVIGETCIIGQNVRIYQGVTLGAKSFPLDENGNPIKGVPRHPIVEDDVIIYAGATLLGRITVGRGSVIGGNVWLTRSVPPYSKIQQIPAEQLELVDGAGI